MYCHHCGTAIPQNARECPNCHAPLPVPQAPYQEPPTMITGAAPPVYTPPPQTAAPAKKQVKPAVIVAVVLGALLVLCLLAAVVVVLLRPAWLPFDLPQLGGGAKGKQSDDYLVGYLQNDDEVDLAWVHGKNEDMIYEDALLDTNYNSIYYIVNGETERYLWNQVDFLPTDPGKLLVRMMDDEDTVVSLRDLKKETEIELFSSSDSFTGYLLENGNFVFVENRSESVRAYVSDGKTEAERVLKADQISYLPVLNSFLTVEYEDEEAIYTLFDLQGNETVVLFQGEGLGNWLITPDGRLMAAVVESDDGAEVQLIDTRSGEVISTNDRYSGIAGLFSAARGSLVYFYGEDEDGFLSLEATTDGTWVLLTEGVRKLAATANRDAAQIAYVITDEDNTSILYTADVKSGESQEIMDSDDTLNLMSETRLADTFFVTEVVDEETTLYRCSFRGGGPLPLLEEVEASISYMNGINGLSFLRMDFIEDSTAAVWVLPKNAEEGFVLLDDWYSLDIAGVSPDGSKVVINGMEDSGDDPVLLAIDVKEGAEPVEIDDDFESVWTLYYTSDGNSLLYNAQTGDDEEDYEVRRYALNTRDAVVETLYEEARVIATGWVPLDFQSYWYAYTIYPTQGSGVSRLGVGQSASGSLGGEVYETRFKTSLEADTLYRVVVSAAVTVNPAVYLYDKDGVQLVYKNDYANAEESVFFTPPVSGTFEIGVTDWNYASSESKFSIELSAVPATALNPGDSVSDTMTTGDLYRVGEGEQYLRFFILPVKANDYLTITVDGFGEDVPFGATLYDAYYTYQTGTYGYGYPTSLYYSAYYDGRMILAITDDSTFYGMTVDFGKDHSFTVDVVK